MAAIDRSGRRPTQYEPTQRGQTPRLLLQLVLTQHCPPTYANASIADAKSLRMCSIAHSVMQLISPKRPFYRVRTRWIHLGRPWDMSEQFTVPSLTRPEI